MDRQFTHNYGLSLRHRWMLYSVLKALCTVISKEVAELVIAVVMHWVAIELRMQCLIATH